MWWMCVGELSFLTNYNPVMYDDSGRNESEVKGHFEGNKVVQSNISLYS